MTHTTSTIHPIAKVAGYLTEIIDMEAKLEAEAENKANDALMPGGLAMVALAGVANLEAWEHQYETAESFGRAADHVLDEDDAWEPPLQTLCFWSEQWRAEHGAEYGKRPTIASEANYIRWALDWAWGNELHWSDFETDIRKAKERLESLLMAGERADRGAPCLYDACKGVRLVRKLEPYGNAEGKRAWRHTDWHCPKCKRSWDEDGYARMVTAAHEASKAEVIDGETWCAIDYAARAVDRSPKTIRSWVQREEISTVCIIQGRRIRFVSLAEVRTRHEQSKKRKTRAA